MKCFLLVVPIIIIPLLSSWFAVGWSLVSRSYCSFSSCHSIYSQDLQNTENRVLPGGENEMDENISDSWETSALSQPAWSSGSFVNVLWPVVVWLLRKRNALVPGLIIAPRRIHLSLISCHHLEHYNSRPVDRSPWGFIKWRLSLVRGRASERLAGGEKNRDNTIVLSHLSHNKHND